MTALNKQALRDSALDIIRVLGYIASFESEDIDGDDLELRFETEDGLDTGCTISITSQCQDASDVMHQLLNELEAAEKRIAELEARKFKVEMPESFYPDGDIDAPLAVDELEVIAAIVGAGGKPVAFCKRCDREIDLTHRPDGSHYCHSPAAGIGVKGD
ncbi:hypothetical protein [Citrobacter sp. FDAARGOS_156]|uniref:hypothetical protein n=1 Tax=Citrobacter sp. FDAARGOS_156 TaxID=1702170 RepID=UPI001901F834|nr:hypothetical protein [Citrobacter sp. FDAARGOS_156]MBJ8926205.1 hypothetical protein [Citrobacter sp. FDAARGOS_156]